MLNIDCVAQTTKGMKKIVFKVKTLEILTPEHSKGTL